MHQLPAAVSSRLPSTQLRPRTTCSKPWLTAARHSRTTLLVPCVSPHVRAWRVDRRVQLSCSCSATDGQQQQSETVEASTANSLQQTEIANADALGTNGSSDSPAKHKDRDSSSSNGGDAVVQNANVTTADSSQSDTAVREKDQSSVTSDATAAETAAIQTSNSRSSDADSASAAAAEVAHDSTNNAALGEQGGQQQQQGQDGAHSPQAATVACDTAATAAASEPANGSSSQLHDSVDVSYDESDSYTDSEDDFAAPLDLSSEQQQQQQQQLVPPPLIDPNIDIANDPVYAIRLLDILDQISPSTTATITTASSSSSSNSSSSMEIPAAAAASADQQQQQQQGSNYSFVRQPGSFCTNCCTPLDPLRPLAPCSSCGHLAKNDTLLLNLGVSNKTDLAAYPAWQQQQQQSSSSSGSNFVLDTKQLAQRLEAGMSSKQAKQLLKDAGILNLPTTLLAYADDLVDPEPAMQLHRGLLPPNHERPERLKVILARLRTTGILDVCDRLQPREATDDELLAVHSPGLIAAVAALSHANQPSDLNQVAAHMAPDVLGNRYTYRAARLAAGTAAEMARQLVTGAASSGMALIRPMGHEAGVDSTEGGNYFNNIAVAARAAQAAGARRVMIIDWDIHHCKGTSEIFAEDPNVLVFSLHRYGSGFYPSSGAAEDAGIGRGVGRTINVAWCPPVVMDKRGRKIQVDAPPISDGDYITAWHMLVLPVVSEFRPDVILVSAGFDAVDKDPLGLYRVHPECFGHLTSLLLPLAPLGLLLEGGYNLSATAAAVEACVRVLLGEKPQPLRGSRVAGVTGWSSILRTLLVQQQHWQSLGMLNFLQLATPTPEDDWEEDRELDREIEEGYEVHGEDDEDGYEVLEGEQEEYELQEGEFEEALETAAAAAVAAEADLAPPPAAAATAAGMQTDESSELMQRVLNILDERVAAGKAADIQQQQQQEEEEVVDSAALTVAEAQPPSAAAAPAAESSNKLPDLLGKARELLDQQVAAARNLPFGWGQQQQQKQQSAAAAAASEKVPNLLKQVQELVIQPVKDAAAVVSDKSPEILEQVRGLLDQQVTAAKDAYGRQRQQQRGSSSGWSAGGFLDNQEAVDSGTESDDDSAKWKNPSKSVDWGLEQFDDELTDQLVWYGKWEAQKQLRRAETAAAEAAAAETAIADEVAAAAAAEKGGGGAADSGTQEQPAAAAAAVGEDAPVISRSDESSAPAAAAAVDDVLTSSPASKSVGEAAPTPIAAAAAADPPVSSQQSLGAIGGQASSSSSSRTSSNDDPVSSSSSSSSISHGSSSQHHHDSDDCK